MTLIEGLRTFVLANASIAAVVGARAFPLRLPQKVDLSSHKGALVYTRVDDMRGAHLRGPNGLSRARIQLDAWAQQFEDATALGTVCRQRLNGYQGTWTDGASPASLIQVQSILVDDESDHSEADIQGGFYRQSTDYFVSYVSVGEAILI